MGTGKVSVIMGIYNCEKTLSFAVKSIQNQTYQNWELIMCDDGSKDGTLVIAQELSKQDSRILVIRNMQNLGLNKTLNHCLKYATGEYIARMDGDDDCVPERFAIQVDFLNAHSEYAIVSSKMVFFDDNGEWGETDIIAEPTPEDVVCGSPICHAPVMMRKTCIDKVGGYTEDARMLRVEDVNLWIKLYTAGYRCYNLNIPLYRMRNDKSAFSRRKYKYRINSTYVRLLGCKALKLNWIYYIKAFKPMIAGLIPGQIRRMLRKYKNHLLHFCELLLCFPIV